MLCIEWFPNLNKLIAIYLPIEFVKYPSWTYTLALHIIKKSNYTFGRVYFDDIHSNH